MIKRYTKFIQLLAKCYIARHKPIVVGVTGSAGKSTAVTAIGTVLRQLLSEHIVYFPSKQLNGELGLPLTIFQIEYFGPTIKYAITTTWKVLKQYWKPNKAYDIIVLEYGVDHVGEMDVLLEIARPDFAIITNIDQVHFGDPAITRQEKSKLIKAVKNRGYISVDDEYGWNFSHACAEEKLNNHIYGFSLKQKGPNIVGRNSFISFWFESSAFVGDGMIGEMGIMKDGFTYREGILDENDEIFPEEDYVSISINSIEIFYLLYCAIGYHIALSLGALRQQTLDIQLQLPPGRATLLQGQHDSIVIDSSYNSSPVGTSHILNVVQQIRSQYPDHGLICLMGEMRELYDLTESAHKQLTQELIAIQSDYIGLVGESTKLYMLDDLVNVYGNDRVMYSHSSRTLGQRTREILAQEGKKYIIAVKGSQNTIYLEEAIKLFLANTEDSIKLCRQSDWWMVKKEKWFASID